MQELKNSRYERQIQIKSNFQRPDLRFEKNANRQPHRDHREMSETPRVWTRFYAKRRNGIARVLGAQLKHGRTQNLSHFRAGEVLSEAE